MFGRIMRSRLSVAVVASTVTAALVGGIAYGVQSPIDGNGVIHGCYNANTGAMKLNVTGACPATGDKTPIAWNQGNGHGYFAAGAASGDLTSSYAQVVSLSLPAGAYMVTARVQAFWGISGGVDCTLNIGALQLDEGLAYQYSTSSASAPVRSDIVLLSPATLASVSTLTVQCLNENYPNEGGYAEHPVISAVPLTNVN